MIICSITEAELLLGNCKGELPYKELADMLKVGLDRLRMLPCFSGAGSRREGWGGAAPPENLTRGRGG